MKFQIQKGSENTQSSSDPNTTQIQVGSGVIYFLTFFFVALITIGIASVYLDAKEEARSQSETSTK